MIDKDEILDYLAMNSDHYKDILKRDIECLKECLNDNDLKLFWDDIRDNFECNVRFEIAKDLALKFNITYCDAEDLIKDADLKEYLK